MFGHDFIESFADFQDLPGMDVDLSGLPGKSTHGLVNHDPRIRQGEALALGSGGEQEGSHTGGLAQADSVDRGLYILHGVVNAQSCRDASPGGVDVEIDVFFRILRFQEQELGNDQVGKNVVNRRTQEDDPVFQEPRINVVGAFASVCCLNDYGN